MSLLRLHLNRLGHMELSFVKTWRSWARLSEGCYLVRSNVGDWTAPELWRAHMQLNEAKAAFRIHKSDLSLRPVWHQKKERVQSHVLVSTSCLMCCGRRWGKCARRRAWVTSHARCSMK
jgi:hypothetical protein